MRANMRIPILALTTALALTGCDSFSILDQFYKDGDEPLTLTIAKSTMLRGETVALYPVGGTKPYQFNVIAQNLYAGTDDQYIGSTTASTFTAGGAIGSLIIRMVDATGKTAEATVTVIPPAPENFSITRDITSNFQTASLSWTYTDTSIIDRFRIVRTPSFSPSEPILDKSLNYDDDTCSPPTPYTYELIAVSGSFQSAAVTRSAPGKP